MILFITVCSLAVLTGVAVLEFYRLPQEPRLSSVLMAAACLGLAGRLAYLVIHGDLSRLTPWGSIPILGIALARLLALASTIRRL